MEWPHYLPTNRFILRVTKSPNRIMHPSIVPSYILVNGLSGVPLYRPGSPLLRQGPGQRLRPRSDSGPRTTKHLEEVRGSIKCGQDGEVLAQKLMAQYPHA